MPSVTGIFPTSLVYSVMARGGPSCTPRSRPGQRATRAAAHTPRARWQTALTSIAPNKILIRGYPLDEMMGRLSFADAVYLLLMGELPSPAIGRMLNAVLVSSHRPRRHAAVDAGRSQRRHVRRAAQGLRGARASSRSGRTTAATSSRACGFSTAGWRWYAAGNRCSRPPKRSSTTALHSREVPPGFGHRFHSRDPRAARLFQMALELELEGEHVRLIRAVERALDGRQDVFGRPLPVNVDGAIAAICADLGFAYELGQRGVPDFAPAGPHRARARRAHAPAADAADRSEGPRLRRRGRATLAGTEMTPTGCRGIVTGREMPVSELAGGMPQFAKSPSHQLTNCKIVSIGALSSAG